MNVRRKESSLSARVLRLRFSSDDSPWKVLVVDTDEGQATVVGEFEEIQEGMEYAFTGRWHVHPRFGEQFRADSYYPKPPRTTRGMISYLSSGLISGIGPKMAKRIVDRFGDDTFDIITHSPERLLEVPGIAETKKEQLVQSFRRHRNLQEVVTYVTELGFTANMAIRLYREYGEQTIAVIKDDPYRLTRDVRGIGFHRADEIARAEGIDPCSADRITAAIVFVLQQAAERAGHTFLPGDLLAAEVYKLLERNTGEDGAHPTEEEIAETLQSVTERGVIVREDEAVYLPHYLQCERGIAERLARIRATASMTAPPEEQLQSFIDDLQLDLGIEYAGKQKEAVSWAYRDGVMVITGGPGTGKTTIVRGILELSRRLGGGLDVLLAAPTGRAARKLSEVTDHPAHTIHRLLGYSFIDGQPVFRHDAEDPLEGDVLIVDETSMIDVELANHLLEAVPEGMRIIFVGDADQLPSVGPGNFLRDLIRSGFVPVIRLDTIFRQDEVSDIVLNAHRINGGNLPQFSGRDCYFMEKEPEEISEQVVRLVTRMVGGGHHGTREVQVLSPMHKGPCGVGNLNQKIQEKLNPPSRNRAELRRGGTTYRTGDKVMCLRNNYEKGMSGIFNGNLGAVLDVLTPDEAEIDEPTLLIDFDGERVTYGRSELDEIGLAYATTVHKAQGSEFPAVIVVVSLSHYIMMQRNLIYTAVTRAEERLMLIGQRRALEVAIRNNSVDERYSRLDTRLAEWRD